MAVHSYVQRSSSRWRWGVAAAVAVVGVGVLSPVATQAVAPSADLSVSVAHAPNSAVTGDEITFTVAAHNDGPDTATAVVAGLGVPYPLQANDLPDGCRRSSSYESILCDLGDIEPGADASVDIVLRAWASGLFTLPAAIASDVADPDTADLAANDVILVKPGPSQAVRYISGIFPIILDRPVDPASLTYWSARWKAENRTYPRKLEKVPFGIINSNEYRRLRIRDSYTRILGRAVDPSSLTYWVNKARSGWSFERIDRALLTSREFMSKRDIAAFIDDTFQIVVGRAPTATERKQWTADLQPTDFIMPADLVGGLQLSTEGRDVVIKRIFQDTLGHDPSPLGRYVWQVRLREGKSPEALWSQLLVSNEVMQEYPYTQDDYNEGGPVYDDVTAADVQGAIAAG